MGEWWIVLFCKNNMKLCCVSNRACDVKPRECPNREHPFDELYERFHNQKKVKRKKKHYPNGNTFSFS